MFATCEHCGAKWDVNAPLEHLCREKYLDRKPFLKEFDQRIARLEKILEQKNATGG